MWIFIFIADFPKGTPPQEIPPGRNGSLAGQIRLGNTDILLLFLLKVTMHICKLNILKSSAFKNYVEYSILGIFFSKDQSTFYYVLIFPNTPRPLQLGYGHMIKLTNGFSMCPFQVEACRGWYIFFPNGGNLEEYAQVLYKTEISLVNTGLWWEWETHFMR